MNLIGNYKHSIDDKGRLTIPSKFRAAFKGKVMLTWNFENTIVMRSEESFADWLKNFQSKNPLDSNVRNIKRRIFSHSYDAEFDGSGRILIPEPLLKLLNIKKSVQVCGVGDEVEIFSEQAWKEFVENSKGGQFEEMAKQINE